MLFDDVWWMCCACCDLVLIFFRIITCDPQIDKARLHEVATMWPNQCHLTQKTQGQHTVGKCRIHSSVCFLSSCQSTSGWGNLRLQPTPGGTWPTPIFFPCSSDSCSPACDYLLIPHVIVWYCVTLFLFLWRKKNTAKKMRTVCCFMEKMISWNLVEN